MPSSWQHWGWSLVNIRHFLVKFLKMVSSLSPELKKTNKKKKVSCVKVWWNKKSRAMMDGWSNIVNLLGVHCAKARKLASTVAPGCSDILRGVFVSELWTGSIGQAANDRLVSFMWLPQWKKSHLRKAQRQQHYTQTGDAFASLRSSPAVGVFAVLLSVSVPPLQEGGKVVWWPPV